MKPKVVHVQCCATVADRANGRSYNLSRSFTVYPDKQCARRAVMSVGGLNLCLTHVRLALDGFLTAFGGTYKPADVSVHRDKRTRPESWAKGLQPRPLR